MGVVGVWFSVLYGFVGGLWGLVGDIVVYMGGSYRFICLMDITLQVENIMVLLNHID